MTRRHTQNFSGRMGARSGSSEREKTIGAFSQRHATAKSARRGYRSTVSHAGTHWFLSSALHSGSGSLGRTSVTSSCTLRRPRNSLICGVKATSTHWPMRTPSSAGVQEKKMPA